MAIQEAVNQLLGQAAMAGAFYAHSPSGKRAFELKDLDNQEKRARERIMRSHKDENGNELDLTQVSPEKFADVQERVKEYNEISKEYAKLTPDVDDALELDDLRVGTNQIMNEVKLKRDLLQKIADTEKANAMAEKEEAAALDEKSTIFADNLINKVQREARAERRDWRIGAVQQLDLKNKFDAFLEGLDEQMWNAGGNN
jgi:hypothetical protein